jgi:transposase
MERTQETLKKEDSTKQAVLYTAFELSNKTWKLAFSNGSKVRYVSINARDLSKLKVQIAIAKKRLGLNEGVKVLSCYEAGRDGFWLHRYLVSVGIENLVVDSSSIEVNRRKRRTKTDRVDAGKLLGMLMRYHGGEKKVWSVVRVPSEEEEAGRYLGRELEVVKRERAMHTNRMEGLLIQQGIVIKSVKVKRFLRELEGMRTWDGKELPGDFKNRMVREYQRLKVVEEQIRYLKKERKRRVASGDKVCYRQVAHLMQLRGIGKENSWEFVMEFFSWRDFKNRKQVGALAGLTPTPYDSGGSLREQGISKAGSGRIRTRSIESAWCWLRFQPWSKLSRWFNKRFAHGGKRMRRIGIVALARKLLIELWRYLKDGVVPEGATMMKGISY